MALFGRSDIRAALNADLYCSEAMDHPSLPKHRLADKELRSDVAQALVRDELFLDDNAGQNLATFCRTWLADEVHALMDLSIEKNMIDKDEYPPTSPKGLGEAATFAHHALPKESMPL